MTAREHLTQADWFIAECKNRIARQREIIATSLELIDGVLARGHVTTAELHAYADDIGPALLGNVYDAADAELTALHTVAQRWRTELGEAEWTLLESVQHFLGKKGSQIKQIPGLAYLDDETDELVGQ